MIFCSFNLKKFERIEQFDKMEGSKCNSVMIYFADVHEWKYFSGVSKAKQTVRRVEWCGRLDRGESYSPR
jgi:hypothetical protein